MKQVVRLSSTCFQATGWDWPWCFPALELSEVINLPIHVGFNKHDNQRRANMAITSLINQEAVAQSMGSGWLEMAEA
jgi:hypothetical protein